MAGPTAGSIVRSAFLKSGVVGDGQSLSGSELQDGLDDFGDLLALWNQKRWLVWHELDFGAVSDGRTVPYTAGPASPNFAMTPAPTRIRSAYVRQMNTGNLRVDTPLQVIESREQYSRVSLKGLISFPLFVFLDTASPVGNLYLYPWPNASIYEIHIVVTDAFPVTVTSPTSFANYPAMTIPGMKFNLARWIRQAYGKGMRPDTYLDQLAEDTLQTIRQAQVQVPELVMPRMLIRGPSLYNIYSDTAN